MKNIKDKEIIKEFEHEESREYQIAIDDTYNFEPNGIYYEETAENWGDFEG